MATVHGLDSRETVDVWEEAREIGRSMAKAPEYVASLSAIIVAKSYMGQLRESLGMPLDDNTLRKLPSDHDRGVWQIERLDTPTHRARANELGRSLTPVEWGEISDR